LSEFSEILVNSAREALKSILGSSTAKAIEFYCDTSLLVEDPSKYQRKLEEVFGIGAKIIEESMVKLLYINLGYRYSLSDQLDLSRCIAEAKRLYEDRVI